MKRHAALRALVLAPLLIGACSEAADEPALIGYVEADWIYIAAPQAGWIVEQPVRAGSPVAKGDLLFRLDADAQVATLKEAEARIRQTKAEAIDLGTGARPAEIRALEARQQEAEARLAKTAADRDRIVPLAAEGLEPRARADQLVADAQIAAASVEAIRRDIAVAQEAARPANRDAAEARTQSAEAAVSAAAYGVKQRTVQAATSGKVEEVFLDVGEFAVPGARVIALMAEDGLKVRFFVPQAELLAIKPGDTVAVQADGQTAPLSATITYIATEPEFTPPVIYTRDARQKLVFAVDARLAPGSGLLPGLPVEITL